MVEYKKGEWNGYCIVADGNALDGGGLMCCGTFPNDCKSLPSDDVGDVDGGCCCRCIWDSTNFSKIDGTFAVASSSLDTSIEDCSMDFRCLSSNKNFILNQFDRRPNFEPSFDIPTWMHLVNRHALHAVRVFLFISHLLFFLQTGINCGFLQARPKNDCKENREQNKKSLLIKLKRNFNSAKLFQWLLNVQVLMIRYWSNK